MGRSNDIPLPEVEVLGPSGGTIGIDDDGLFGGSMEGKLHHFVVDTGGVFVIISSADGHALRCIPNGFDQGADGHVSHLMPIATLIIQFVPIIFFHLLKCPWFEWLIFELPHILM